MNLTKGEFCFLKCPVHGTLKLQCDRIVLFRKKNEEDVRKTIKTTVFYFSNTSSVAGLPSYEFTKGFINSILLKRKQIYTQP